MKVYILQATDFQRMQSRVNKTIEQLEEEGKKITDIQYSTTAKHIMTRDDESSINYSVMIVFEKE